MAEPCPDLRIFETPHCTVDQAHGYRLPGYLIVEIRGDAHRLSDLSVVERDDLFAATTVAERLVQELVGPERIYVAKYAELNPRVHVHVIPRTARLGAAYAAATPLASSAALAKCRILPFVTLLIPASLSVFSRGRSSGTLELKRRTESGPRPC